MYLQKNAVSIIITLMLLMLLMSACSSKNVRGEAAPQVDMNMILPPAATYIDIPDDKVFLMAATVDKVRAVYPSALLNKGIEHQNVCVEIVVGDDGAVHSVIPLYEIPECPESEAETPLPFIQSVSKALLEWQFLAAVICTFPPDVSKNDQCEGNGVEIEPIAIKLAYVFEFTNRGGEVAVKGMQKQVE